MKTNIKHFILYLILLVGAVSSITSCSTDQIEIKQEDTRQGLRFIVKIPEQSVIKTRSENQVELIDVDNFNVLLFKENKFYKNCMIKGTDITKIADKDGKEYQIKIDIPRTDEVVDFMVLSNYSLDNESLIEGKTTKEDFIKTFKFTNIGVWNLPFMPLWGELKQVKLTEDLGTRFDDKLEISLLRAAARIDLLYKDNNIFEVSEIYLYNTLADGTIAPIDGNYTVTDGKVQTQKPSLPAAYRYNGGTELVPNNQKEKLINAPVKLNYNPNNRKNTIAYIPEQANKENDKYRPCIVLGIKDKMETNGSGITYYRVDFRVYTSDNKKSTENIDILRNHKYIFTLNEVNGVGKKTPKEAAQSPTTDLLDIEGVIWDENINQGYISGSQYFGIETTNILFTTNEADQKTSFKIQTNIENVIQDLEMTWKKENNGYFEALVHEDNKGTYITVSTKKSNELNNKITNTLIINAANHQFEIEVEFNTAKGDYTIIQKSVKVYGLFYPNVNYSVSQNENNYIEMVLEMTKESYTRDRGKEYNIVTNTQDGLYFEGKGSIDGFVEDTKSGKMHKTVKIFAQGSSLNRHKKHYSIIENSLKSSFCTVDVNMVYRAKKVLAIGGSTGNTGYGWGAGGGGSKAMISYDLNYGLLNESKVKIPAFIYDKKVEGSSYVVTQGTGLSGKNLKKELEDTDIFIYGYKYETEKSGRAEVIADYLVNQGGVVIAMDEDEQSPGALMRAIYDELGRKEGVKYDLNITNNSAGPQGTIYPMVTQPGDQVMDGPFNINGEQVRYWGEDYTTTQTIVGVPEEDIVVYSRSAYSGREATSKDKGLTIFRHLKVNLFFIGDGGFVSNNLGATSYYLTRCPFWLVRCGDKYDSKNNNPDFTPTYKFDYGNNNVIEGRKLVGNAIIFANTLAWAIDKAEFKD